MNNETVQLKINATFTTIRPALKECSCEEVDEGYECRCTGPKLIDVPNNLSRELSIL